MVLDRGVDAIGSEGHSGSAGEQLRQEGEGDPGWWEDPGKVAGLGIAGDAGVGGARVGECGGGRGGGGEPGGGGDGGGEGGWGGLDGVGGDESGDAGSGDGDAASGEAVAEVFDGAADALLGGLGADAELGGHVAGGLLFEVAEEDSVAFGGVEFGEDGIEVWLDFLPGGVCVGRELHGGGLLFAGPAADLGADDLGGDIAGGAMEPAGEDGMVRQGGGVLGEGDEDGLGGILGEVGVADDPERDGVGEVDVSPDEFAEGGLGVVLGVGPEQLWIGQRLHSSQGSRRWKNRTKKPWGADGR